MYRKFWKKLKKIEKIKTKTQKTTDDSSFQLSLKWEYTQMLLVYFIELILIVFYLFHINQCNSISSILICLSLHLWLIKIHTDAPCDYAITLVHIEFSIIPWMRLEFLMLLTVVSCLLPQVYTDIGILLQIFVSREFKAVYFAFFLFRSSSSFFFSIRDFRLFSFLSLDICWSFSRFFLLGLRVAFCKG